MDFTRWYSGWFKSVQRSKTRMNKNNKVVQDKGGFLASWQVNCNLCPSTREAGLVATAVTKTTISWEKWVSWVNGVLITHVLVSDVALLT